MTEIFDRKAIFGGPDVVAALQQQASAHKEASTRLHNLSLAICNLIETAERNGFVPGVSIGADGVVDLYVHMGGTAGVPGLPVFRRAPQDAQTPPPAEQIVEDPAETLYPDKIEEQAAAAEIEAEAPVREPVEEPVEVSEPARAPHVPPVTEADPLPKKTKWPRHVGKKSVQPKPGLIDGPFTPEDDAYLIEKTVEGVQPAEIAASLTRKVKQVANRKQRLKKEIDQARKAATENRRAAKRADVPAQAPTDNRALDLHLANLPMENGWTPTRDLKLIKYIIEGAGVAGAGAVLKVDSAKAKARYMTLTAGLGDDTGAQGLLRLLSVLRQREGATE